MFLDAIEYTLQFLTIFQYSMFFFGHLKYISQMKCLKFRAFQKSPKYLQYRKKLFPISRKYFGDFW